ncbi:hypothetical protein MASR1M90_07040 [Desulfovibrionales bacterium]
MHRIVCFCHFLLLFLCVFCSPAFSNQELPLNNDGSLVSVEYVGVNPPIESIKNDLVSSEILLGDVALSLSATLFGTDPTVEHAFLLRPEKELLLEFFTVDGYSDQGVPLPGQLLATHTLHPGNVFLFRHLVPEGIPNLLLCVQDETGSYYWYPRFSGVDGFIELDQGFSHFMGQ